MCFYYVKIYSFVYQVHFFGILFVQINIIYYFYLDNNYSNVFFILNFESIYQIFFIIKEMNINQSFN